MYDKNNHTCDENKHSIFETHNSVYEVCFTCDEIHFSCDEVEKSKNENEKSRNEIRFTCDEIRHGRDRKNHTCGFFINSSGNKQFKCNNQLNFSILEDLIAITIPLVNMIFDHSNTFLSIIKSALLFCGHYHRGINILGNREVHSFGYFRNKSR
jgi:hypothetical protein